MKRISIIVLFVLLAVFAVSWAQEVVYTNQITVGWDEVTALSDGSPVPAEDSVVYEVYTRKDGAQVLVGETSELTYTFTFTEEGVYDLGVRAVRITPDGSRHPSEINWSDVNGAGTPNPFVVYFYRAAAIPENLHVQ